MPRIALSACRTVAENLDNPEGVAFDPGDEWLSLIQSSVANLGGYHIGAVPVSEKGAPLPYPELS